MNKAIPKWHGEPVEIEYVMVTVKENKEKPLFWYNYDCAIEGNPNGHSYHEAIRVTTKKSDKNHGSTFLISNEGGRGINKLRKGGWPDMPHASFNEDDVVKISTKEDWTVAETCYFEYENKFCEKEYAQKQSERREWQKRFHPEEFKKSEVLREMIMKSPIYNKSL